MTVSQEIFTKIRRLYFGEHWKIGTISAELGLHRDTVSRVIGAEHFCPKPKAVAKSLLDPYKSFIKELLEKHPKLRSTRIYLMIKDRGYIGSDCMLRRYVRTVRPQKCEAYFRRETLPGEEGQVDWAHFGKLPVDGTTRTLSCFVMVLGYSRAIFAQFFWDQQLCNFLSGHKQAFEYFGGVPRALLYDNLKSAVLDREGERIRFHPAILDLAGHYHFEPKPCAPYRGNEKGKVERTIQYLRHSFFDGRAFQSLSQLNQEVVSWIENVANVRPCPGQPLRKVRGVFEEERTKLFRLPEHPLCTDLVRPIHSQKTPYIKFDLNLYSIPHSFVTRSLTLCADAIQIRLLDEVGNKIAEHRRSFGRNVVVEDPKHLEGLFEFKRNARALRKKDRLLDLGDVGKRFLDTLLEKGLSTGAHVKELDRLLALYGESSVKEAMEEALSKHAVSSSSVNYILNRNHRNQNKPPLISRLSFQDPRADAVRVRPHDLRNYDHLISSAKGDEE